VVVAPAALTSVGRPRFPANVAEGEANDDVGFILLVAVAVVLVVVARSAAFLLTGVAGPVALIVVGPLGLSELTVVVVVVVIVVVVTVARACYFPVAMEAPKRS
jgi:hypothetical protein